MTFRYAALVAAGLAVVFSSPAGSHHPVAAVATPITRALGIPVGGETGGALAGAFVVGVGVAILIHEIRRPRCNERRSIFVDPRHDVNPKAVAWVNPCKRKAKPVRARG